MPGPSSSYQTSFDRFKVSRLALRAPFQILPPLQLIEGGCTVLSAPPAGALSVTEPPPAAIRILQYFTRALQN